ncbi:MULTISPECIES: ferredoxin [Polymorphospora]|uniref:Ferredoxin n=1 Tax=Polymorphospora lycopeni TaxID=3140240 RepID=A0ABV5CNA0_9ACTN
MSALWRVHVDPRRCIGSGICAGAAPDHFVLVADASVALAELVEPSQEVTDAAESCPMEAITVRDALDDRHISPGRDGRT